FRVFRGNIREMHEKIAAGRIIDFEERMYFDEKTNKFYNGIYVTAYVSKGAQNTWEKVLDGTLSGFSIGGAVLDYMMGTDDDGNAIRIVTKYMLDELSLVDNPANQLANVLSIQKSADGGTTATGLAVDVETQTIVFCSKDNLALVSKSEIHDCSERGDAMGNIG